MILQYDWKPVINPADILIGLEAILETASPVISDLWVGVVGNMFGVGKEGLSDLLHWFVHAP